MVLSIRRADALLRGGQRDQARALLASLEASAPGFIVLTSAAERDALGRADFADLARTYLAAAHAALLGTWLGPGQAPVPDPGAAAALYVQAAELLAYEVGGAPSALDEARGALGKALEAVPGYPAALEALTELDDTTGNVAEALARLSDARPRPPTADGRRALVERAIRLARSHGELEAVVQLETRAGRARAGRPRPALAARVHARPARPRRRARRSCSPSSPASSPTRRGAARRCSAAARLRERGGAVEQATELYRQVLALWPEDTFARESLIDLLRAQEKWTELVTERRAEARALPDGAGGAPRAARGRLGARDPARRHRVGRPGLRRVAHPDARGSRRARGRGALPRELRRSRSARSRRARGDRRDRSEPRGPVAARPRARARRPVRRGRRRVPRASRCATRPRWRRPARRSRSPTSRRRAADTVMRVEATASLAGRTTEPRLGARARRGQRLDVRARARGLRARGSSRSTPRSRWSRPGAARCSAPPWSRRAGCDPPALSAAYDGPRRRRSQMPEAAAALPPARRRDGRRERRSRAREPAGRRRARSPRPTTPARCSSLAETGAVPVVESAGDDAAAIDRRCSRAPRCSSCAARSPTTPRRASSWELDRAEALELAGRLREAGTVVSAVLKRRSPTTSGRSRRCAGWPSAPTTSAAWARRATRSRA